MFRDEKSARKRRCVILLCGRGWKRVVLFFVDSGNGQWLNRPRPRSFFWSCFFRELGPGPTQLTNATSKNAKKRKKEKLHRNCTKPWNPLAGKRRNSTVKESYCTKKKQREAEKDGEPAEGRYSGIMQGWMWIFRRKTSARILLGKNYSAK